MSRRVSTTEIITSSRRVQWVTLCLRVRKVTGEHLARPTVEFRWPRGQPSNWIVSLNLRGDQSRLTCNDLFGVADVRIRPRASQIFRQLVEARQKRTKLQDKDNL